MAGLLARRRRARARARSSTSSRRTPSRIATLLGSNAPPRALVAELGRIREHELQAASDPERDEEIGARICAWFGAQPSYPNGSVSPRPTASTLAP